jgi:hypothetical protein
VFSSRARRLAHRKRRAALCRSRYEGRLAAVQVVRDQILDTLFVHPLSRNPATIDLAPHKAEQYLLVRAPGCGRSQRQSMHPSHEIRALRPGHLPSETPVLPLKMSYVAKREAA